MFASNSLDKNCIGPDCSSGRNSASNRFPVGITSLGDENQQIRIQLAVHKYNSSTNSPINSRCAIASPFRHSFLNNPVKAKNYETDGHGTSKNEGRNGNQYEGVGAFPTIHLKKKAIRYRPIKRYNDVKVSYPELPVNRFLSNLPGAYPDLKSSTRSVLDVLEDLSGKKIHSKDDQGSSKTKSKGLGGDYLLNTSSLYKPLFVQKPKVNSVVTRDNTTQTFSPVSTGTPSPQSSCIRNDASDSRAELRKKLAKKNNEIFASLSSSISFSPLGLKRKIGKVLQPEDENFTDGSAAKTIKLDNQRNNINSNGVSKTVNMLRTHSGDSIKTNRKNKLQEPNSPTSPNKDRLTTIFLDMQNASPRVQMFQKSIKSVEDSQPLTNCSNGFTKGSTYKRDSFINGAAESNVTENEEGDANVKNVPSSELAVKSSPAESKKPEIDQPSKLRQNFLANQVSTASKEDTNSTSATFQVGGKTSSSDFNSCVTSQSDSKCDESSKNFGKENNPGKKDDENQISSKPFVFGNSNTKPNFSAFQFGVNGNLSSNLIASSKESHKALASNSVTVCNTTTLIPTPQFSFGTSTKTATVTPQSFVAQFDVTCGQKTSTSPVKPLFSFGQNNPSIQQSSDMVKTQEKNAVQSSLSTSVEGASNVQSSAFNFGQKSTVESPVKTTAVGSELNTNRHADVVYSVGTTNSVVSLQAGKSLYTFGGQRETSTTLSTSTSTTQEPKFSFSFGQKIGAEVKKVEEESALKSKNLFSFGQKSVSQESQSTGVSNNVVSPSQSLVTETSSSFGQNVSQVTGVPQMKFGQMSAPQISNSLGDKSEANSLVNSSAPTLSQCTSTFPIKSSVFGSSNGFGNSATQNSAGFKSTPASTSSLVFGSSATTQPTPTFGVTSASQTVPAFVTSTAQSVSGFGVSPVTQPPSMLQPSGPTSTYGQPTTTQSNPTFPISSTAQSGSSFAGSSTTQSVPQFGSSLLTQSTPSFGIPSATQSTSSTFGIPSVLPGQSTSGFGASTTQTTSAFGASNSHSSTTFGASTTQPTLGFGISTSNTNTAFGTPTTTESIVRFGAAVPPSTAGFGVSTFSSSTSSQQNTTFGTPALTSNSGFGSSQSFNQPFENKPATALGQSSSIFGQNQTSGFSSSTTFNSNQSNIFEQKPSTEGGIFDQNKMQTPNFGTTSQTFNTPNKYSFGMTTSSVTGFTSSPPSTTSAPVFSFGSGTTPNTFTFGSASSASNNTQFAFKSSPNEPFKFGATTTKEGSGFGGSTSTFTFGGQMNNNSVTEQKPSFTFGSPQASSSAPFSFGATPSPSVFNFGGSAPASSGSGFNFGTPTPGGPFGQSSTASTGTPFTVPGTFSIGSGSSQSRPRATARPRRRP